MTAFASNCVELIDMAPATWAMVDFRVPETSCELVSDFLWSFGVQAVEERDAEQGYLILRTSLGTDPEAHIATVCAHFEDVSGQVVHLRADVSETWRKHVTPTMVEGDIAIVPAWIGVPAGTRAILIEPGDTFGLGNHPTTLLTLRMALEHIAPDDRVFDLGCGSGVLAIGLSRLLGNHCDVFDIADSARSTVAANCILNDVDNVEWNENFDSQVYDAVLANILAPVLRAEARRITGIARSGGLAILSGMRSEQVRSVVDAFEGWTRIAEDASDGWSCVALRNDASTA